MVEKKYIIGATKMTEVIYMGVNVHANGGSKKKGNRVIIDKKAGYSSVLGDKTMFIPIKEKDVGEYHVKNYSQRNKKRSNDIEDLCNNNFHPRRSSMITLTFGSEKEENVHGNSYLDIEEGSYLYEMYKFLEDMNIVNISNNLFSTTNVSKEDYKSTQIDEKYKDLKICDNEFKKFIQRMNYRYNNFKYVAVRSKQKETERWHYHMICNISYIEWSKLLKIWGKGTVYISKLVYRSEFNKKINYLKKNMYAAYSDLKGKSGVLRSKDLNKNIVYRSWRDEEKLYFEEENKHLNQAKKNGLKYYNKHIHKYEYKGKAKPTYEEGIFMIEGKEYKTECTIKYYKYQLESNKFKLLDEAEPKIDKRKQAK